MAAKNVLDRKLRRPVERVMSVGHVLVEFQGPGPIVAAVSADHRPVGVVPVDDGEDGE
jgi:hypothetical protein